MARKVSAHVDVGAERGQRGGVALGGFGSMVGALAAGLLVGLVESLTALVLEPSLKQIGMFAVYLPVLVTRI